MKRLSYIFLLLASLMFASLAEASADDTSYAAPLPPGECNITGTAGATACPTSASNLSILGTGTYSGVRTDPGNALGAIDVWGKCRYVNNVSSGANSKSLFVPFRTSAEWEAFIGPGATSNSAVVNLLHCSKPQTNLPINPSSAAIAPSPATRFVDEPNYYPCAANGAGACTNNPTWSTTVTFTSNPPAPGASWTETATATFTGLDSDFGNSWQTPASVSYTATAAACGASNGGSFASAPSSGLCSAGAFAGSLAGAGPWSWTCTTGQPPVPVASCGATATVCTPYTGCDGFDNVTYDCGGTEIGRDVNSPACGYTGCSPSSHCQGFDYVTLDCSSVEIGRSVNSPICGYTCTTPTSSCEGLDYVTRDCLGAETGRDVGSATCAVCTPNATTEYGACSATCGGGTQTVTVKDSCGNVTGSSSQTCNTTACPPVEVCAFTDSVVDVDGFAADDGRSYCSNFNLYDLICSRFGLTRCDIFVTVDTASRCAADTYQCWME
ncbi:MAG: hypothetical protein WAO98_10875 [Alphaproteobacteria bacterium]